MSNTRAFDRKQLATTLWHPHGTVKPSEERGGHSVGVLDGIGEQVGVVGEGQPIRQIRGGFDSKGNIGWRANSPLKNYDNSTVSIFVPCSPNW